MITKIVQRNEVYTLCQQGWILKDIRELDMIETLQVSDPPLTPNTYGLIRSDQRVVRSLCFVMELNESSEIARLSDSMSKLSAEHEKALRDLKIVSAARDLAVVELNRCVAAHKYEVEELKIARTRIEAGAEKLRKYEMDLAKLRKELGEAEMRRILGE